MTLSSGGPPDTTPEPRPTGYDPLNFGSLAVTVDIVTKAVVDRRLNCC